MIIASIVVMILVLLGCLALTPVLVIGIVYQTAKNDRQLTFRRTGEIKFRKHGGQIIGLIMDIRGKDSAGNDCMMEHDWDKDLIVPSTTSPRPSGRIEAWFNRNLKARFGVKDGLAYVGILYPLDRLEEWQFNWPKLVALRDGNKPEGEGPLLKKYGIVQKNEAVKSLYYQFVYPVLAGNIELEGNFTVSVLTQVTLTIMRPLYLVGNLKGKFMPQAISEIIGLIDNGLRTFSIKKWRENNRSEIIRELLVNKSVLSGAIVITDADYVDFDYTGNSKEVINSITLNQIEFEKARALVTTETGKAEAAIQEAKAIVTRAEAAKKAAVLQGEGEAERLKLILSQFKGNPDGADVYMAELQAEAIRDFKSPGTLIIGKSRRAVVTVPVSNNNGGTST